MDIEPIKKLIDKICWWGEKIILGAGIFAFGLIIWSVFW